MKLKDLGFRKKTGQVILTSLLLFWQILGEFVHDMHAPLPILMKTQ